MQSYIKYKVYYDRKAKAAPLKENDYCFVLQPKRIIKDQKSHFMIIGGSDHFQSKKFYLTKIMLYDESIQTRLKYCIGFVLKSLSPTNRLRTISELQPDEEIVIPQDDLYIITWETDFGEQLITRGHDPIPTSLPNGEQPNAAEPSHSDVDENEADYIITSDETNYADNAAQSRNERLNDDVTKRNEATEAASNEESDWPNPAVYPENPEKSLPNIDKRLKNDKKFPERNLTNENDAQNSPNKGDDIIVPEISEDDTRNEFLSPRGGKYNLRPNPIPNYSEDFRY